MPSLTLYILFMIYHYYIFYFQLTHHTKLLWFQISNFPAREAEILTVAEELLSDALKCWLIPALATDAVRESVDVFLNGRPKLSHNPLVTIVLALLEESVREMAVEACKEVSCVLCELGVVCCVLCVVCCVLCVVLC